MSAVVPPDPSTLRVADAPSEASPAASQSNGLPAALPARAPRSLTPGGRAAIYFISPALLTIGLFFGLPVLAAFVLSLTDFDLYALGDPSTARFVGLRNYVELAGSAEFWRALGNTLYFVAVGGPLSIAASLGAALLVNARGVRFRAFFRTVFFAPVVTTLVAVAVVWRYLYHVRYGLFNYGLEQIGLGPVDWLGDPRWAMPAIILLAVWKNFGYNMIIFIAGLQNVPEELYEASHMDGASPWQQFRFVTLPQLAPTFLFVGVLTMVGYFQLFAEPYVMTEGGPVGATVSVVYLMFVEGFRYWNLGYASAVAFVLFLLMFLGTLVQLRLQKADDT